MKHFITIAMCVCAMAVATAQEKKGGLMLDLGMGVASFGNFSPVSVMDNDQERYSLLPEEQASIGYMTANGKAFVGLTLGVVGGNTLNTVLDEQFLNINIMADLRDYFALGSKLDLELGVAAGLMVHSNYFDLGNDHYSFTRLGANLRFSVGLDYKIDDDMRVGLRTLFPCYGSLMGDAPTLPAGLDANRKTQFVGYGLQLHYNICF